MTRTPARVTQADVARAIRAAKQAVKGEPEPVAWVQPDKLAWPNRVQAVPQRGARSNRSPIMTNPDRGELVKLNEAGLEAAVRECARITAPEITNDEYERIKADNSPRYQNTRTEMARAIRAYLRAAKPALSSIVTCCVTGAIPGDGGACGDCDPCLLGEASVPAPVKTLIAEKNSLIHRVGELEDELDSLRRLGYRKSGCNNS